MVEEKPALVTSSVLAELRRLPRRRLDGDWLATDNLGRIGFFAGGDAGPVPDDALPHAMPDALEAIARAIAARRATASGGDGYRGSAKSPSEPVFDRPPGHERRFDGYAHLVFAGDAMALRQAIADAMAEEVLAREAMAVVYPTLGWMSYDALHDAGACGGCRVLDMVDDPRPTAAEVLASVGLYVFRSDDAGGAYVRVTSPSTAADLDDLEPIVRALAELVKLPVDFEAKAAIDPRLHVTCE